MLNIVKTAEGANTVFELEGRLDTVTAPNLEQEIKDCIEDVQELVLNIEKLEYISSAGLRAILAAQQYMEGKELPDVKVININEVISEIFTVTGFDTLIDVEME